MPQHPVLLGRSRVPRLGSLWPTLAGGSLPTAPGALPQACPQKQTPSLHGPQESPRLPERGLGYTRTRHHQVTGKSQESGPSSFGQSTGLPLPAEEGGAPPLLFITSCFFLLPQETFEGLDHSALFKDSGTAGWHSHSQSGQGLPHCHCDHTKWSLPCHPGMRPQDNRIQQK